MTAIPLVVDWGHTWLITGVGFGMVFVLLVFLIYVLKLFGAVMGNSATAQKKAEAPKAAVKAEPQPVSASSEDDLAAVALALHLYYNGVHDEEPTEITIRNIERRYSPWNAKTFGINNLHR